jgi:hypothetical protein
MEPVGIDLATFEGGERVVADRLLDVEMLLAQRALVFVDGHGRSPGVNSCRLEGSGTDAALSPWEWGR